MEKTLNKNNDTAIRNTILYEYCSEEWHPIIDHNQIILNKKKGELIFSTGEQVKGIYIIINGKVKVVSPSFNNEEHIHRLTGDGKILGHRGFSAQYYPISAIALTDLTIVFVPNEIFKILIKTNPSLSFYMIEFFAEDLRQSEERMKNLMYSDVKNRIAKVLLTLIDSFGYDEKELNKLSYSLSRKDFASMAGVTYETVIRTLKDFQDKKFIKLEGKEIFIINLNSLRDFVFSK
ncbi:MAG: hypothetical protein A3F72_21200 [Bacteroidetes bacterium RIFCSPLOWO2_12_FULL_35_15]|nr:MAG: hypothetical protein A3F72_21200 [Bacteroidetes bacterium RIFCSPLOWO2_12_FULL_35_15]